MSRNCRPVKQNEVAEMVALAKAGHCAKAIARRVGRSHDTVRRYCGPHLVPVRDGRFDAEDLRDWYAADRAERERLAEQHGYASAQSMCVVISRAHAKMRAEGVEIPTRQDLRVRRGKARALAAAREFGAMEPGSDLTGIMARFNLPSPQALYQLVNRGRNYLATGKGRVSITDDVRARIFRLADEGRTAADIADEIGCHKQTIHRIAAGRLKAKAPLKTPDRARLRRIVNANASAAWGSRDEIAARFGLASASSLTGVACYGRKVLAREALA